MPPSFLGELSDLKMRDDSFQELTGPSGNSLSSYLGRCGAGRARGAVGM